MSQQHYETIARNAWSEQLDPPTDPAFYQGLALQVEQRINVELRQLIGSALTFREAALRAQQIAVEEIIMTQLPTSTIEATPASIERELAAEHRYDWIQATVEEHESLNSLDDE